MKKEIDSLSKNHTWNLVPQPQGMSIVKCRWVYRTKFTSKGVFERHKAHLIVKGFSQQEVIVYTETFAPVAKMNSVQLILSLVAHFGWKIHEMDVKSAFLHGDLFEEIFMENPLNFVIDSNLICRIKKLLCGLKQTSQAWYVKINSLFLRLGFKLCESDHSLYVLNVNGYTLIFVVYVNDLLITCNNNDPILRLKKQLVDSFDMIDLGTLHYFLGIQVLPLCDAFFIS
jgi:hypothetical protein